MTVEEFLGMGECTSLWATQYATRDEYLAKIKRHQEEDRPLEEEHDAKIARWRAALKQERVVAKVGDFVEVYRKDKTCATGVVVKIDKDDLSKGYIYIVVAAMHEIGGYYFVSTFRKSNNNCGDSLDIITKAGAAVERSLNPSMKKKLVRLASAWKEGRFPWDKHPRVTKTDLS